MKDRIFVQFYDKYTDILGYEFNFLCNGFSYVHNECKEIGDFYWSKVGKDEKLPILKGEAYVSTSFSNQVLQAFVWAEDNPNIKFIVGGPAVRWSFIKKDDPLSSYRPIPDNVEFRYGLAEKDIFGKKEVNNKWTIEPPKDLDCPTIFPTYVLNRHCYWNKCTFCEWKLIPDDGMKSILDLKVPDNYSTILYLITGSISPEDILKLPKLLELNVSGFQAYVRADDRSIEALPTILEAIPKGYSFWHLGVEFPSNSMLKSMRKGITVESIKKILEVFNKYTARCSMSICLGWNTLKEEDIKNLEDFIVFLEGMENPFLSVAISRLYYGRGILNSELLKTTNCEYIEVEKHRVRNFRSFYFIPVLSKKEKELNRIAFDLLMNSKIPANYGPKLFPGWKNFLESNYNPFKEFFTDD